MDELQQALDKHLARFHEHIDLEEKRWKQLLAATEANTMAIQALADSTRDIVDLYQATVAGRRLLAAIGKAGKWLASLGVFVVLYQMWTGQFKP